MTLANDNGTDGQTNGQTDGQSATQYAAPSQGGGPHNKREHKIKGVGGGIAILHFISKGDGGGSGDSWSYKTCK